MMRVHVVAAFAVFCCGAVSAAVTSLPADVAVPGGRSETSICGDCCQSGSYCGKTSDGRDLTCMLRARDVFGAVDGGMCVPSTSTGSMESFCQLYTSVNV